MPPWLSMCGSLRNPTCIRIILAILAAVHVAIVSSILVEDRSVIWPLHHDTIYCYGRGADFYAVYHAGVNTRRGMNPYIPNNDGVTPYHYPFRYLPIVALAAQALTYLTPNTAYLLWILLLEGLLVLLLFIVWRSISDPGYRLATVALLLVNSPYFLELHMGQFTFAAVALCYLGLVLPAGSLLFTLSVLLKPLSLAVLPAIARERRYWFTCLFAIACLLLVSVPYFIHHPGQGIGFVKTNFLPGVRLHTGNCGLVYLMELLAIDGDIALLHQHWGLMHVFRFLVLATTALLVFHSRASRVGVGVSALLLAHFLTYQDVWEHHMTGVCVVAAVLMTVPDCTRLRYVAVLFCLLLLALPTPFGLVDIVKDPSMFDPKGQWPRYAFYIIALPKVLPTLALYAIAMSEVFRGGFRTPREAIRNALTKAPAR
ncbi:hypothetical protein [Candidatus Thiosymbion oneisti]|uniref:hypothetical protein n=1 Tax=Candidatus Thiosymbion oneisti TaxID=589554 RepID=UPI00105E39BF|nr:hypothetical protein [Candidatus Thiosymbion oneisti]